MPSSFTIIPQRRVSGKGWQDCPDHAAGRWMVCEVKTHGTGKAKRVTRKQIAALPAKAEAVAFHHRLCRKGHERGLRKPKIIAQSLTQKEYLQLKLAEAQKAGKDLSPIITFYQD
jgi:hypothetical protein